MTKDKARKHKAREQARTSGKPYTLAARDTDFGLDPTTGAASGRGYADGLARAFVKAGWLHADAVAQARSPWPGEVRVGPMDVVVYRGDPEDGIPFGDTEGPDAGEASEPLWVGAITPVVPDMDDVGAISRSFATTDVDPGTVVAKLRALVAESRAIGVSNARVLGQCDGCSELFPAAHLMQVDDLVRVCPDCVFVHSAVEAAALDVLQFQFDQQFSFSWSSAQWGALAVLTAVLMGHSDESVPSILGGDTSETRLVPPEWEHPEWMWVWLPQGAHAPRALRDLGAGATLGAVMDAIDAAHPNIRETFAAALPSGVGSPRLGPHAPTAAKKAVDAYWPAVVAFAVGYEMTSITEDILPSTNWAEELFLTEGFDWFQWQIGVDDATTVFEVVGSARLLVNMIAPDFITREELPRREDAGDRYVSGIDPSTLDLFPLS